MTIIGGGASGLVASISASKSGKKVTILEQNSKIGKKIIISGNGKCNISNRDISKHRYHSLDDRFVSAVLDGYGFAQIEKFFHSIGLLITEGKDGKMYPLSGQSSSVVEILQYEATKLGVNIICNCQVTDIEKIDNTFNIQTTQGLFKSNQLILASGSPAYPQIGGSDDGYKFAKSLGHNIILPNPSLVQLRSDAKWLKEVSGVKVSGEVKLYANGEYITQRQGDLLFTNYGISGLAILDISRAVSTQLSQYSYCQLSLDLMPNLSKESLINLMMKSINPQSDKPISLWLQGLINQKLINTILTQSKCKVKTESQLNKKEIIKLIYTIKNLKMDISDTKGWSGAEVATGGVDTTEVNPKTMESKIVPNLYLTGEILDIDGDRGGFNLHFAWVCGLRIGGN